MRMFVLLILTVGCFVGASLINGSQALPMANVTFPPEGVLTPGGTHMADTTLRTRLDSLGRVANCLVQNMALAPQWIISIRWAAQQNQSWSALTHILPEYRRALIEVDSVRVAQFDQDGLKRLLIHELFHLPAHNLALLAMDTDSIRGHALAELLVVTVERWPVWTSICLWSNQERES